MTWLDMLTLTVAGLAVLECVAGRLAAMHPREHRTGPMLGYLLAVGICLLAGYLTWQGADASLLDVATYLVAAYLVATWGDWRHGAPLEVYRARPVRYQQGDLVPSSQFDDGRR